MIVLSPLPGLVVKFIRNAQVAKMKKVGPFISSSGVAICNMIFRVMLEFKR